MKTFYKIFLVLVMVLGLAGIIQAQGTIAITKSPAYIPTGNVDETQVVPFAIYVTVTGATASTMHYMKVGDPNFTAIGNLLYTYRNGPTTPGTWGNSTSYTDANFQFMTDATGAWEGWVPVKAHRSGIAALNVRARAAAGTTFSGATSTPVSGMLTAGSGAGFLVGNLLNGTGGSREDKIVIGYNGTTMRGIWLSESNTVKYVAAPIAISEGNTDYSTAIGFRNAQGGYAMLLPNGTTSVDKIEIYDYPNNLGSSAPVASNLMTYSDQNITVPNSIPAAGNNATVAIASDITLNVNIPDGAGSALLTNETIGLFTGATIFSRNAGSQTVKVTITGIPAGPLDQVRLTIPTSDFSGFSSGNVTLGGAFAGKTPSYTSNTITIASANLSSTPGTITISGLTSPNPVGSQLNGNSTWKVETAASGGTLTEILSSAKSYTMIPIANIRTGGDDGYGNNATSDTSKMNTQKVAVAGVATVQDKIIDDIPTHTSFFLQEAGHGIQIYRASVSSTTIARGDSLIILGSVDTYNGQTEVVPLSTASPNLFLIGPGVMPSPVVLANAAAINESYEGRLIKLNSVNWISAGATFTDSINKGRSNFTTAPLDSGTIIISKNNAIYQKVIPVSSELVGIIYQRSDIVTGSTSKYKVAPRDLVDLGFAAADGSGTATINPISQVNGATSVTETMVLKGDGTNTIAGMSVTIPSSWTWTGNLAHVALSGAGFASATRTGSGIGSVGDPWIITVSGAAVTNVDLGTISISNLTAPSAFGSTTFTVQTRGASGALTPITVQPTVAITPTFPFIENFEYATSSLLTANNWTAHSGIVNLIAVNADPLTYSKYVHSGVGKSVTMTTNGEDVNRGFLTVNTGSVYASFMVKVDTALIVGEYFFHLSPTGNPSNHIARLYFKKNLANNLAFGVGKGSTDTSFTPFNYTMSTTYLAVMKYTFNTGSTTDDEIKLWINPVLNGVEPSANVTLSVSTTNDPSNLGTVALRQGAGNATPALILGGLRIDTSWIPSGAGAPDIIVSAGWNMISIPYTVADYHTTALFPTVTSDVFAYNGVTYILKEILENAVGYWAKFAVQETLDMGGTARLSDTARVIDGWNMIGTVASQVAVVDIEQIPPGLVQSDYFRYDNSYLQSDTIEPGRAYWVKTAGAGKLYMSAATLEAKQEPLSKDKLIELNSLTITDKNGNHQTLYFGVNTEGKLRASQFDVPPLGPANKLDVRFATQRYAELLPEKLEVVKNYPIMIQANSYPLTISWKVKENNTQLFSLKNNASPNQPLSGEGKITIDQPVKSLSLIAVGREIPTSFSLGANYPNPFNPTTKFVVAVPKAAQVEIVVYDILGRKVRTLLSEETIAGYHTVEWNGQSEDGAQVTSGVYFVRMVSEKFNAIRKIMMVK